MPRIVPAVVLVPTNRLRLVAMVRRGLVTSIPPTVVPRPAVIPLNMGHTTGIVLSMVLNARRGFFRATPGLISERRCFRLRFPTSLFVFDFSEGFSDGVRHIGRN